MDFVLIMPSFISRPRLSRSSEIVFKFLPAFKTISSTDEKLSFLLQPINKKVTVIVLVCGSNDKHPIYGNIFITEIGKNDYESTNPKFKYAKIFFDAMIKFSKQTQTLGILTKNHLDQT